ncbi:MAG TPA: DEAD/DEAH box helicase family protein [Candidatus Saccharimonadales bacterium]|nr:DEAD/DEAH box helicase family protein [Candidatus Saccharimonadales bacterium]
MTGNIVRPPEVVALADWLVGPFSHDEQMESGELAEWQVPFYDVALGGLRRIAGLNQEEDLPLDFQPDPLKGVELYRELAYDRKVHGMITSLHAYIGDYKSGELTTKLRDHQQEIMDVLAREIATVGMDRQINIKSPTGTGKTAILTTLIEALKYKEQPNDKVRALVLLPTKDILGQTAKAFKKFTGIEAATYFGESKAIGDVTAMTYQSFKKALERGDITEESFDVVIRDEADTFSRGKTGEIVDQYCRGSETGRRKLAIGLTATPHEEQKLSYERTVLESISDGLLAPLSTYQRHTHAVVREDSDRDWREDFKDSEIGHLMDDPERNGMIIEEIVSGLESGRRVLLRCIPGDGLRHPKIINDMLLALGKIDVKHPYMGDVVRRRIRPVIIPGDMTMRHRELLTGVFNNHLDDRIDVLLFVGTLIRGFDSPVAKKVINAAPTRSPAIEEQLLGRAERWFETHSGNVMDAQAVDIVDSSDSGQITFEDIVNRDAPEGMRYRANAIIGPGLADVSNHSSAPGSAFEPIPLDELTRAAQILSRNGFNNLDGINLRMTALESLSGHAVARVIGAAALLGAAKQVSMTQALGRHLPLGEAASALDTTPADLMLTAHRMRVGIETAYDLDSDTAHHFFSQKAFARLKARHSGKNLHL